MFVSPALPVPRLSRTFSLIVDGLCRTTAARIAVDRFAGPVLVLIFHRLSRLAARFASLVNRLQAGPLPPPRASRPTAGISPRSRPKARLPEDFAWLIRLVPGTAAYAGQVQALLADPQTTALLAAAPQAGRILRPLCRMLAIPLPDHLRRSKPRAAPPPAGADPATSSAAPPPAPSPTRPAPRRRAARATPRRGATATGLPPRPD